MRYFPWTPCFLFILIVVNLTNFARGSSDIPDYGRNCTVELQRQDCGQELVCIDGFCQHCSEDYQCQDVQRVCQYISHASTDKLCDHKSLFPFSGLDALVVFVAFLGGMLAAGGGLGGGGVYVPIFLLLLRFSAHGAIPLSKSAVFGGASSAYLMNYKQRNPNADRPMIDYNIAALLVPMTLAGTVAGVFLNIIAPEWLILFLLVVILGSTTIRSLKKGKKLWKEENEFREEQETIGLKREDSEPLPDGEIEENPQSQIIDAVAVPLSPLSSPPSSEITELVVTNSSEEIKGSDAAVTENSQDFAPEILEILAEEKNLSKSFILFYFLVWLLLITLSLLRGGHGNPSIAGILACSPGYWVITILIIPICFFITYLIVRRLLNQSQIKQENDYPWHVGDIIWDPKTATIIPIFGFLAGIASGLLGVGGGVIFSPLLLELKGPKGHIDPDVVVATSHFMILYFSLSNLFSFTASSTTFQFIIHGALPVSYAMLYVCVGFLSTVAGKKVIRHLVEKYQRRSIIIFTVSTGIGVSVILMTISGSIEMSYLIQSGRYLGFGTVC